MKIDNILVTGSGGQLGSSLKKVSVDYPYTFFFKQKKELDVTNFLKLENFIKNNNINTIINCAAYTDVEKSEINFELADLINHTSVDNLALLCKENDIQLIHISTDFVFDGKKLSPYLEDDQPNPLNVYGKTKFKGENKILKYNLSRSIILRTSWLYSNFEGNFVSKILNKFEKDQDIFVVDDEIGSPTNAFDLARIIMKLIPLLLNSKTEIYHFSNLGACSRFELVKKIKEIIKSKCVVSPIEEQITSVKRPKFSALNSLKIIKDFQLKINHWETSLENHLKKHYTNEQIQM